MATDTKPRTPGAQPTGRAPQPTGRASQQTGHARPRGSGGNGFPPGGGSPGGRPPGKISSPRHTRPSPAPGPGQRAERRQQRMPFILLLVGLLGGALISLLVISTTLDEGSYDINNLTSENNLLYKDEQGLLNAVNQDRNPAVIASEAAALGLRRQPDDRFINPSTGAILIAPGVSPAP